MMLADVIHKKSWDEATLISEEIKPVALAII